MNSPAPVLDTDYRPPPAGAPAPTAIARRAGHCVGGLGSLRLGRVVSSSTKVQGGDYRPLLEGEVLREGIEREKLYGCRSKDDLLEFGIVPKIGGGAARRASCWTAARRASTRSATPLAAHARCLVEFEDLDEPAEAGACSTSTPLSACASSTSTRDHPATWAARPLARRGAMGMVHVGVGRAKVVWVDGHITRKTPTRHYTLSLSALARRPRPRDPRLLAGSRSLVLSAGAAPA